MGLMKVYNGIVKGAEQQVSTHTDNFHIISEELELESYIAPDGVLTDFMTTAVTGGGAITYDAATHSINFDTGAVGANSVLYSTKDTYTLGEHIIVATYRLLSHVPGTGTENTRIGLYNSVTKYITFYYDDVLGIWRVIAANGASMSYANVTVTPPCTLTVAANKYRQTFYIDGVKVHESGLVIDTSVAYSIVVRMSGITTVSRTAGIGNFIFSKLMKPVRPLKL